MLPIKTPVYYFEIMLDFKTNKVETKKESYSVIGTNDDYFAINDRHFSTLQYKPKKYGLATNFRKVETHHSKMDPYWDYIQGHIYTHNSSENIAQRAIKKAVEKFLYEKFGRYCKGIDLLNSLKV